MSALLNGVSTGGAISITNGSTTPDHFHNGLPYEADGSLAVEIGAPTHYHQGLGFSAAGRLSSTVGSVSYFGGGAAPFTASLQLAQAVGVEHYSSGVPYSAAGAVSMA